MRLNSRSLFSLENIFKMSNCWKQHYSYHRVTLEQFCCKIYVQCRSNNLTVRSRTTLGTKITSEWRLLRPSHRKSSYFAPARENFTLSATQGSASNYSFARGNAFSVQPECAALWGQQLAFFIAAFVGDIIIHVPHFFVSDAKEVTRT